MIIKVGPVGRRIGNAWDEKGQNKIVQIFICHGEGIKSIQFQYADENGKLVVSDVHGKYNGRNFDVVKLGYPTEHITWVKGRIGGYLHILCSITFGTNRGEYGPFGMSNNYATEEFAFRLGDDRQFCGFHGTANESGVESIGVYLEPIATSNNFMNRKAVKLEKNVAS
ncbi:Protein RESTRICTED TEV MOVEMENT 1 [Striga hermonthica]|uniref:Protein RESTRICTED TEV MOVEMENT 1 n=1 Tax=Striga hermonthica TaxID=68872 RepID=A0A9N7NRE8_STRHE|nr:Protein RESTRICTED TEV MOVEMENT 1 [Striga hermonthica]